MTAAAFDACLALAAAHARLQRKLDDELGTYHGLDWADFRLLSALASASGGPMPTAALCVPLGVQPSAVVRQLIALEKTGWIARETCEGRRHVVLRSPGRRVQAEAAETAAAICAAALDGACAAALGGMREVAGALSASSALELRR